MRNAYYNNNNNKMATPNQYITSTPILILYSYTLKINAIKSIINYPGKV